MEFNNDATQREEGKKKSAMNNTVQMMCAHWDSHLKNMFDKNVNYANKWARKRGKKREEERKREKKRDKINLKL